MTPAPDLVFREVAHGSDDYRHACNLREAVLRQPLGLAFSAEELLAEFGQLHFGLFAGETLQACLSAVPLSDTEVKLRQMAVRPEMQGRGLGRSLVGHTETELVRRGFAHACLHARTEAVGFYSRLGYQPASDEFLELGIRHLKMQKHLSPQSG